MTTAIHWLSDNTYLAPRLRRGRRAWQIALCTLFLVVASVNFAVADSTPQDDATMRAVAEVIKQIKAKYVGPIDDRKLAADAIRGIIQGLDPFSDYLEPEAYSDLKQENGGKFGGLGMEVAMDAGAVRVVSAFEDSPAFQAGLRPGDLITRLNEVSVEGLTLEQAIHRARGEPDTSVVLTVLRKGDIEPRIVSVRRAVIQSRSVKSALLGSGYGYIKITQFNQRTADLMLAALTGMARESGIGLKGVLLDLRDNPGGLLKSAVAVSSVFLPQKSLVVYTESAVAQSRMRLQSGEDQFLHAGSAEDVKHLADLKTDLKTLPLVVLVNSGSASAAEIVAGAMQDHRRATVVGTQTFGKGSVQVLVPLADGAALKLTTAYYLTPEGQRIQGKGVTPDVIVEQSAIDTASNMKPTAVVAGSIKTGESTCTMPELFGAQDAALLRAISGNIEDCQLGRAIKLLSHLPVLARG